MLSAYTVGLELIRASRPVVVQLHKHSAEAAKQVEEAASSIVRNIAEGQRRRGRDPVRFYAMAHGSANEVRGQLDVADAWGWDVDSAEARRILDRELALLWGLTIRGHAARLGHPPRLRDDVHTAHARGVDAKSRRGPWVVGIAQHVAPASRAVAGLAQRDCVAR